MSRCWKKNYKVCYIEVNISLYSFYLANNKDNSHTDNSPEPNHPQNYFIPEGYNLQNANGNMLLDRPVYQTIIDGQLYNLIYLSDDQIQQYMPNSDGSQQQLNQVGNMERNYPENLNENNILNLNSNDGYYNHIINEDTLTKSKKSKKNVTKLEKQSNDAENTEFLNSNSNNNEKINSGAILNYSIILL